MALDTITQAFRDRAERAAALDARVLFDMGGDGVVLLDGRQNPAAVSNAREAADCTITLSMQDMQQMLAKEVDGQTLFGMGRLSVDGDFAVAMRLSDVFGG
ncbi:MAG: SCP2 sterol-binding domain-containing protein [Pseudomonadota bacterium]